MPKPDMTLQVNIDFNGLYDGTNVTFSNVSYSQGTTAPSSPNVVDSSGDIDLTQMNLDPNSYSKQTDITFHLNGTVTDDNGNDLPIFFQSPSQAITINGNPPTGQFTPTGASNSLDVTLDDVDNDGQTYEYCLNVTVQPTSGGTVVGQLDPSIINRGNN